MNVMVMEIKLGTWKMIDLQDSHPSFSGFVQESRSESTSKYRFAIRD